MSIPVSQQDIDDIVCTALEGGINYWCGSAEVKDGDYKGGEYASDVISRGGTLTMHLLEDCDVNGLLTYELNVINFLRGFQRFVNDKIHNAYSMDGFDIDANDADIIIQYALFDDIVFG